MKLTRSIVAVAALTIALAGIGYAQKKAKPEAKPGTSSMTETASGTIKLMTESEIVIEKVTNKGTKQVTLAMNSATEKKGNPKVGSVVSVRYRHERDIDVATSVRVEKPKKG